MCICCGMVLDGTIVSDGGITILKHKNKIRWNNVALSHRDGIIGSVCKYVKIKHI